MDWDDPECSNWAVWVRCDWEKPSAHGEPFSSIDKHGRDFTDLALARSHADALVYVLECAHSSVFYEET